MIAYVDTSALIKILVEEDGSADATETWATADVLVTSVTSLPESRAALAAMHRAGRLSSSDLATARVELGRRLGETNRVDVTEQTARSAGDLAERHGLRGYDAIHVASALAVRERNLVVLTWDRAQAGAARAEGLMVAGVRP